MPKRRPLDSVGLPGYAWDSRLNNFVNTATGRMVKRQAVTDILQATTKSSQSRMAEFGRMAANGDISPRAFYEAMRAEMRIATNANAALAKGGLQQMTQSDWGKNGWQLRQEYERLGKFAQEIADGSLTPAQIEARAQAYANTTFRRFWEVSGDQAMAAGHQEKRLITVGDERTCQTCVEIAGQGWIPIARTFAAQGWEAMYPPIHPACRCEVETR